MKFKKAIFTSVAAVSLGAVVTPAINITQNTVEASTTVKKLTKNAYVYNAKGKRVKKVKLAKGKKVAILGTKLINGKKYYRIGKNQYIKVANFKTFKPDSQQPSPNMPSQTIPAPTTPTQPATQAERDSFKEFLKKIYSITENGNPENEKYEMSSYEDRLKFSNAVSHAHMLVENKYSTIVDLNNAKAAVKEAYNKLDGQRYQLPCSLMDFDNGMYTLTDADKTAILNLVNKVKGTKDAHFTSSDNQYVKYTIDDLYPTGLPTDNFLKFVKR